MKPPAFTQGKKNMTLEKLLIFGFALAALLAVTTVGANMMNDRGQQNADYEAELGKIKGF
ncbi:MAG: hypothetical protein AAFP98_12310, partial [Pseudomonadota bacterium]